MPLVVYQPMSMIINAFKTEHVQRPLPGFGVLVPSKEQRVGGIRSIGTGKIKDVIQSFLFFGIQGWWNGCLLGKSVYECVRLGSVKDAQKR